MSGPDKEPLVRFEDSNEQKGFTQIPNVVMTDERLRPLTRYVYGHLRRFAWHGKDSAYPGIERLTKETGLGERALRVHINYLVEAGLVKKRRRGQGQTNVYLIPPAILDRHETQDLDRHGPQDKEDEVKEDEAVKERNKERKAQVQEVFNHWQTVMNRERSRLTPNRSKKIQARLEDGIPVSQLKRAIDGCAGSEFHVDGGHNDLTLICRNEEKVEQFASMPRAEEEEDFFAGTDFA